MPDMAPDFPARPARHAHRLGLLQYLWIIRRGSIETWHESAFEEDFFVRRILHRRIFYANSPDAVRHVLLDNADNYTKGALLRRMLVPVLGQGLVTSEGALWRRQRRILAPAFSPRRVRDFVPVMATATAGMLARWETLPAGRPVDVAEEMVRLTLEIIAGVMFSEDLGGAIEEVGQAVTAYQLAGGHIGLADLLELPPWVPRRGGRGVARATAQLDRVIRAIIARRRASGPADQGDLMSLLLAARDEETGEGMSDSQLRDEVATILLAGHETTANALTWTWYLLSGAPEVTARLHDELATVLGGRVPRAEELPYLAYTRSVIEEAMRLYPPAYLISRQAVSEDRIAGWRIPSGATVFIVPWLLHRHKKLWERPDAFDPEHFAPDRAAARPRFAYVPFGGGPRSCLGASFAMTEALVILATVAQRYVLCLIPGHRVRPVGLITLRPEGGLPMMLERR